MLDETRGDTQKVDGATDSRHTKISKLPLGWTQVPENDFLVNFCL